MRIHLVSIFTAIGLLFSAPLSAQNILLGLGGRVGATLDPDQGHAGLHLALGGLAGRVRFQPNVELGVGSDMTVVAINPEVIVPFRRHGRWIPYAGAGLGLNIIRFDKKVFPGEDNELEVGLNLLGGYETRVADRVKLFVEGKVGIGDSPDFKVAFGFTVFH
jgi:hypothetical protein